MPRAPIYRLPNVFGMAEPLTGELKPGATLTDTEAATCNLALAGLQWFRIHFESTADGELKVEFYRSGGTDTVLGAGNPIAVAVTGGTPVKLDVNPHFGEHAAKVTFTPTEDGAVTWSEYEGVCPARR